MIPIFKIRIFPFFSLGKSEDPVALSRWERVEESTEDEQPKEKKSKWEKVEGVKMGKSVKEEEADSEEEPPRRKDRRYLWNFLKIHHFLLLEKSLRGSFVEGWCGLIR